MNTEDLVNISDVELITRSDAARETGKDATSYRKEIQRRFRVSTDLGASLGFIDGVEYP